MLDFHWTFAWTLAAAGAAWLVVSVVVALALGRMIRRSDEAMLEPAPRDHAATDEDLRQLLDQVVSDRHAFADNDVDDVGTRTSGTRLKPVRFDDEEEQNPARIERIR